jgi:uncharacterized DUF497 family protein
VKVQWDERKNQANIRKHGLDFSDAWGIFELPMVTDIDSSEVFEQRLAGIGFLRQHIVVVIFVEGEGDTIRIISLRKALKDERERFEGFLKNELGAD